VVLVIAGITLGLVSLNAMPDEQQLLNTEARRIASLLQLAREEAIVRNRPVAFEAYPDRYRFTVREETGWQTLAQDELLRERSFTPAPLSLSIDSTLHQPGSPNLPLRIVFGREPLTPPFLLTLATSAARTAIRSDGSGRFQVE